MKKPIIDKAAKLAAGMARIAQGWSLTNAAIDAGLEAHNAARRAVLAQREAQAREESPRRPC